MSATPDARSVPAGVSSLVSRRDAILRLGGGLGVLGLADLLACPELSAAAPQGAHAAPRAKRIIQLFMNGGPFGPDFLDPKPALAEFAGQRPAAVQLRTENVTGGLVPSPFRYAPAGESGLPVSDALPLFSKCIDDVCVIRSLHTDNPNHGPALQLINSGSIVPTRPSLGSWLLYGLGSENANLPGYIVLCPGRPVRFSILWSSAFLPGEHQGTYINHEKITPDRLIPYLQPDLDPATQSRSLELLRKINERHRNERTSDPQLEARIRSLETAFRMQTAATDAFDLAQETEATHTAYGDTHFSRGCLLARRLVERGVRFVQVYYGNFQPWDTHGDHDRIVTGLARDIDRPMAALLTDLKQRGLLEDTLVVWGGEFGRTPVSEGNLGRDHNHYGFTTWLAGGGVRGGMSYGETDEFGFKAAENPVHIHDLHATILHLMGIDHTQLTYRYSGRDFRLTDVHGHVLHPIMV